MTLHLRKLCVGVIATSCSVTSPRPAGRPRRAPWAFPERASERGSPATRPPARPDPPLTILAATGAYMLSATRVQDPGAVLTLASALAHATGRVAWKGRMVGKGGLGERENG